MACLAYRQSKAYNAHQQFETPVGSFVYLLTKCRLKTLCCYSDIQGETTSTGTVCTGDNVQMQASH